MAIEDGTVGDLGVMVLDELHMVDDDHRGYLMCVTSEHSFPSFVNHTKSRDTVSTEDCLETCPRTVVSVLIQEC